MKKFQRTRENFTCQHCSAKVQGTGYTNHCPHCLWSKHVDINPGDRQATCGGMMEPIDVESRGGQYNIIHQCVRCGYQFKVKVTDDDNTDTLVALSE
jgi:hypothetical protein